MSKLLIPVLFFSASSLLAQPVTWTPESPTRNDIVTFKIIHPTQGAFLHWGVNGAASGWSAPSLQYWPTDSRYAFGALESPFSGTDTLTLEMGPFNNPVQNVNRLAFVVRYADTTWDNNNSQDYHITFTPELQQNEFVLDGNLDRNTRLAAERDTNRLYVGWNGIELYVATNIAPVPDNDIFIFLSRDPHVMLPAVPSWSKKGLTGMPEFFVGRESMNGWSGFFDSTAAVNGIGSSASGQYLEGSLPLGAIDTSWKRIYLAVGYYETQDSGSLVYQIPAGNGDANIDPDEWASFDLQLTGVQNLEVPLVPRDIELSCYPNPFNPSTTIRYSLPLRSVVRIDVLNLLGEKVLDLVNSPKAPGSHEVSFDGSGVASGVYFCRIHVSGPIERTKFVKMLLIR